MLCGADEIVEATERHLGIKRGARPPRTVCSPCPVVECLGACCNAPMVQINDDYFEDLTPDSFVAAGQAEGGRGDHAGIADGPDLLAGQGRSDDADHA